MPATSSSRMVVAALGSSFTSRQGSQDTKRFPGRSVTPAFEAAGRLAPNLRQDHLNAVAGGAYCRMEAEIPKNGRDALACTWEIDPSTLSKYKAGLPGSPLARLLRDVWRAEADGHSTDELVAVILAVQAQARGIGAMTDADLVDAWWTARSAEQRAESEGDQVACTRQQCAESVHQATAEEVAAELRLMGISAECAARGLDVNTGRRQ